jgi:regulator of replication initiation timing
MGSTLDFLGATIADALSPRFRRPVEDIIYETIDRKQIPTRTDFTELRNTLNSLRSQSTGAQKGVEKLKSGLDDIEESIHELTVRLSDLEGTVRELQGENSKLKADLNSKSAPTASGSEPSSSTVPQELVEQLNQVLDRLTAVEAQQNGQTKSTSKPSSNSDICKVHDCDSTVRAGGFCNSHYGKWRRGTLKAFVSYDGTAIASSGSKVLVGKEYSGLEYVEKDGEILVDSKAVAKL